MRHYCAEASIYGNVTHPATQQFGKVLVILNPTADKKSSADTVGLNAIQKCAGFIDKHFCLCHTV